MEITLSINKGKVYGDVTHYAAYIGAKNTADENAYERISIIDEDKDLLDRLWDDNCAAISAMFKAYLYGEYPKVDSHEWSLRMPQTFSSKNEGVLNRLIHQYMVFKLLYDWLMIIGEPYSSLALQWLVKAENIEDEIDGIKHSRTDITTRPTNPW